MFEGAFNDLDNWDRENQAIHSADPGDYDFDEHLLESDDENMDPGEPDSESDSGEPDPDLDLEGVEDGREPASELDVHDGANHLGDGTGVGDAADPLRGCTKRTRPTDSGVVRGPRQTKQAHITQSAAGHRRRRRRRQRPLSSPAETRERRATDASIGDRSTMKLEGSSQAYVLGDLHSDFIVLCPNRTILGSVHAYPHIQGPVLLNTRRQYPASWQPPPRGSARWFACGWCRSRGASLQLGVRRPTRRGAACTAPSWCAPSTLPSHVPSSATRLADSRQCVMDHPRRIAHVATPALPHPRSEDILEPSALFFGGLA